MRDVGADLRVSPSSINALMKVEILELRGQSTTAVRLGLPDFWLLCYFTEFLLRTQTEGGASQSR